MNVKLFLGSFLLTFIHFSSFFSQSDSTIKSDTIFNLNPVFTTVADLLDNETQSQDVSGLLQSSRDVFAAQAGFNFSTARFRFRGYSSEHTNLLIEGLPVNDPESGWAIWSYWGGLNDMTRYPQVRNGISASPVAFGGLSGYSSISLRPSTKRSGHRISYASTNRAYRNRLMYSYNSGLTAKGWAFSACVSTRYSDEGYIDGTYYSSLSYLLGIEKKINSFHSVSLVGFAAPTVQARQGIALQEVYDLTGNNYYNPYWGYQTQSNGTLKKRNARLRDNHKPYTLLSHYWTPNEKIKLSTTLYAVVGKTGNTNLNWYDAQDPRPDYYRYLPSFYSDDPQMMSTVQQSWQNNDPSTTQLDWDGMYNANYKNLYSVVNPNGNQGTVLTANRSKYIVEEYRLDPRQFGFNSIYNQKLNDKLNLSIGLNIDRYTSFNYKLMDDLLGGDFWIDVDQFAEQDFEDQTIAQNDLLNTNNIITAGDRFGYDYNIHVNKSSLFTQLEGKFKKMDFFIGITGSNTNFYRVGNMQNGRFPDNSLGKSEKTNFSNFGAKLGVLYKVTGRHFLSLNGMYETEAPFVRNAYVSPRTRDQLVPNLESTISLGTDLTYNVRYPNFRAKISAFYSQVNNQTWARSFYHDEYRTFVNYMMTNVDQLFTGIEIGLEKIIASSWQLNGAFTVGDYLYNSRPLATITRDNSQEIVAEDKTIFLKNYKIGGMPQTAASVGLKYNSPKYWYVGTNFNYFAEIYMPPNPDRRTQEALAAYVSTDPQVDQILNPEKLENGYTLNIYGGKSWKIRKYNSFVRLNINVNNLLNNTQFRTGGYEQLRYDINDIDRFPNKYGYMYGLTYFAMLSYLF